MTFIERFTCLMNHYGLSAAAFARRIGVTSPSITHILNGRNKYPSTEMLIKISESFPQVSTAWLLMDQGPMLLDGKKEETSFVKDSGENPNDDAESFFPSLTSENPAESLSPEVTESRPEEVKISDKLMSENPDKIERETASSFSKGHSRRVTQIMAFYDDGTYELFRQASL